jgi:phosphoribosylanthranilate isomerase
MFRVKICGITNTRDAEVVGAAGADAVGLNFFSKSARFIEYAAAKAICGALPEGVLRIGLFVNEEPAEVRRAFESLSLDAVQLHGDETPQYLAELGEIPVICALRLSREGIAPVHQYLAAAAENGRSPRAVLLDSFQKGCYGGTGKTANWPEAAQYYSPRNGVALPPLILAGGLTPENVAIAIDAVAPFGVDTAGGVERSPGVKSPEKVRAFVQRALNAFHSHSGDQAAS